MNGSFWAGITVAETASQLALGAFLIAGYRQSSRLFGTGAKWLGPVWATLATPLLSGATAFGCLLGEFPRWLGTLYALALTGFVLSFAATVGRAGRFAVRRAGWLLSVAGLGLLAVVYFRFPVIVGSTQQVAELTGLGRAVFFVLIALQLAWLAYAGSKGTLSKAEGRAWALASGASALMVLVDALPLSVRPALGVPLTTHLGVPWMLALGVAVLDERAKRLVQHAQLSAELSKSRDELRVSHVNVERIQRELGAKKQLAAVGELAASIAHEVRNPLAIIMNAAAGLRRPTLQAEDRNTLLGILDEETARLNRLVTDLLRFARPVIIKRSSVSVIELAKRVEGRLEDGQVLTVEIPDEPSLRVVQADVNLLRLVFDNLVANAFQAMPDGGTVKIVAASEQIGDTPYVRLSIIDHGHGMDDQVRARAVDPFYTTRPSGTGLGLPIVERIVEAHGGSMEIESAPGRGTTITMLFPRLEPDTTEGPLTSPAS